MKIVWTSAIWFAVSVWLTAAALVLVSPAWAATPKNHAEFMKNDVYKNSFAKFTATMDEAKSRLSPEEFQALEKENDKTMAESVQEDMAAGYSEVEAWDTAYTMISVHVGDVLVWDWLKKNAQGLIGYYRMNSSALDGYMTVEESDEENAYAIYIFAAQKTDAQNNGEIQGLGRLNGTQMRLDFGGEEQAETVDINFEGETATVATSAEFKNSGWFGGNVIIDGEYVREKK
ncbi:MAG: hypothetical protein LBJ64_10565 [Deltaproteobacteria bacterium]|nr:hypothetical protein [Deltaproteobacteria bacterium]